LTMRGFDGYGEGGKTHAELRSRGGEGSDIENVGTASRTLKSGRNAGGMGVAACFSCKGRRGRKGRTVESGRAGGADGSPARAGGERKENALEICRVFA
jgi:hypothetical protein